MARAVGRGGKAIETLELAEDEFNVVEERSRIRQERDKQVEELLSKRKQLAKEVNDAEKKLRSGLCDDVNHNKINLTQYKINGYFLSNFSITKLKDEEKVYTASCEENGHPFKISLTMNGEKVSKIDVMVAEQSALNEIRSILHVLCESNSPHLVLTTIQQFIHLNIFRGRVITEKLQGSSKNFFHVYRPELIRGSLNTYLITACRGTIEIQWTMVWDKVHHCMVHDFQIPSIKAIGPQNIKRLCDELLQETFFNRNEPKLWDWWTQFCKTISSVQN